MIHHSIVKIFTDPNCRKTLFLKTTSKQMEERSEPKDTKDSISYEVDAKVI